MIWVLKQEVFSVGWPLSTVPTIILGIPLTIEWPPFTLNEREGVQVLFPQPFRIPQLTGRVRALRVLLSPSWKKPNFQSAKCMWRRSAPPRSLQLTSRKTRLCPSPFTLLEVLIRTLKGEFPQSNLLVRSICFPLSQAGSLRHPTLKRLDGLLPITLYPSFGLEVAKTLTEGYDSYDVHQKKSYNTKASKVNIF